MDDAVVEIAVVDGGNFASKRPTTLLRFSLSNVTAHTCNKENRTARELARFLHAKGIFLFIRSPGSCLVFHAGHEGSFVSIFNQNILYPRISCSMR